MRPFLLLLVVPCACAPKPGPGAGSLPDSGLTMEQIFKAAGVDPATEDCGERGCNAFTNITPQALAARLNLAEPTPDLHLQGGYLAVAGEWNIDMGPSTIGWGIQVWKPK